VNPRPTQAEMQLYYPFEFYGTHLAGEALLKEKARQLDLKHQYVREVPPGRLLDVGCMKGEFMYFMQQRGWEVQGIEWSTKPPNVFGLDIHYGSLQDAGYRSESFDLITLWAVLEHVYAPREMLEAIHTLLKPQGRIVLLVTNFQSLPARLMRHDDIPRHTSLFTRRTLRKMLLKTGFRPDAFHFNCELFGGVHRGTLNYLVKLLAGEPLEEIVAQNRTVARWQEFSSHLRGKPSDWMLKVDRRDRLWTPYLDRLLDRLGYGFIMTVIATKEESFPNAEV
jgi:SAM-dependent methyltransferase